jgi:hypothetical protein
MTRTQSNILITVIRDDRANTVRVRGTHIPRKNEAKPTANSIRDQIVRSLPPPIPARKLRTASKLAHDDTGQHLAGVKKTTRCDPCTLFLPRSDSP